MTAAALRRVLGWAAFALAMAAPPRAEAQALSVVQAGPEGALADLTDAAEVRVSFSEPMVALGRIPQPVQAPFFKIRPALAGRFRWAGTRTLIFTPEPGSLTYATRYAVEVEGGVASGQGRRLAEPHRFSFTTPTLRLLRTSWYRESGRYDSAVVLVLRFNQPVSRESVSPHLGLRSLPHDWIPPALPPGALARLRALDPNAVDDFEAKLERTRLATRSSASLGFGWPEAWDQKRFPASDDMLVLRSELPPPTDSWIQVRLGPRVKGTQGRETPGQPQEQTVKLEPTFFVEGFRCTSACDPDGYNPLRLRSRVGAAALGRALKLTDATDAGQETRLRRSRPRPVGEEEAEEPQLEDEDDYDRSSELSLEDAGYRLAPARRYAVVVDRTLTAADGQSLGYTWAGVVENWHQRAFTSFGSGHGVWEKSGGAKLPFYARNLQSVTQWLQALSPDELMPTIRSLRERSFDATPAGAGTPRKLAPRADSIQSHGVDLAGLLAAQGTGLIWAALRDGTPIPRAHHDSDDEKSKSTLVQVTNLGLSVKDSPHGTLVLVTRLDDGQPVEGARVSIRNLDNAVIWTGASDRSGIALAPAAELRSPDDWYQLRFLVMADKDGDVAYACSDWTDGIEPWDFGLQYDLEQAKPLLRGAVFSDRGVYRLGEEVRLKALLRRDTAKGIELIAGASAAVAIQDSQGNEVDKRSVVLGEWSSSDWSVRIPEDGPLGRYTVSASVEGQQQSVTGSFLVAAYRRPDFRVDANLAAETSLAGVTLKGVVSGRYLFGAPMQQRGVRWRFTRTRLLGAPPAVREAFPEERYAFLDASWDVARPETETLRLREDALDAQGRVTLDLETDKAAGAPFQYSLEGEVTDLSRQSIAGSASFRVDPTPWYLGLRQPPFFAELGKGFDTEVVAVGLEGRPVAGVPVQVTLTQVQWHGVRRAEGQGYYTWETERREVAAGSSDVTTAEAPQPLHVPLEKGGYYVLRATARDAEGRSTTSAVSFYALGPGYTAWQRHDHNRVDLVPEKKTYKPGETARILVKSPWERATALLTTEREGVRSHRTFQLSSTQETLSVPIGEQDIPNVYVSVLLVKGRSDTPEADAAAQQQQQAASAAGFTPSEREGSLGRAAQHPPAQEDDPNRPSYRVGYVELRVDDGAKRLAVTLTADREEYRPATRARIDVAVKDAGGRPGSAEVTLWAVDYGVLSLTAYKTPEVLGSVYVAKALQVLTQDSRQNIISRRVLVSKGADEGGGGGDEEGPGTPVRKDFRVLAFWLGSLVTDAEGRASTQVTLPESLTTYRIMAVAGDKASRFGWGERELRISKPVLLRPAFPRFLSLGDTALFGSVVNSQLGEKGTAIVTIRSLDPSLLEVVGEAKQSLEIQAKGSAEVRFQLRARAVGRARVRMSVRLLGEADAFEEALPVEVVATPEVVAAYGQAKPKAEEAIELPDKIVPSFGSLHLELSSTALTGLGEGARYLVDYPYGCAEQRSSAALGLMLAAELGDAFRLPGIEPSRLKQVAGSTLEELESFQCANGGFGFWKGECRSVSPYLTSYLLHVLQRGRALDYPIDPDRLEKAYAYLEGELGQAPPSDDGRWPAYTAWQAFAVKVLSEGGRRQDSHVARLFARLDRMPVFALAYLRDALAAAGETGERAAELERRMRNAVLPEAGSAHVEELSDPYLLWFWSSNVRSTALVLGALVRSAAPGSAPAATDALVPGLVRWMLAARKNGRWGNTQENASALEALVDYYRRSEAEVPNFQAVVALGLETLATGRFQGRAASAQVKHIAMKDLLGRNRAGGPLALSFEREGTGTLFYAARLQYAPDTPELAAIDQGFEIERRYTPEGPGDAAVAAYKGGELVRVTLRLRLTKERRYVAVTDHLPAGFEPVESWFATTASDLAKQQQQEESAEGDWTRWWQRGGFDRVERHDDRVLLFATRLGEGEHEFSYVARATTAGTFHAAPARAEEMYEPEVFGRTASTTVEVRP